MEQDKEIELLEAVEYKLALSNTGDKLESFLETFLVPLLNKLNCNNDTVLEKIMAILNRVNKRIKTEMELRLPIQELFELYESQIQKTGENVRSIDLGLFYIQKAFERTPDNEKGLYLERLLKEVTLKSMPQQRIINSILLQTILSFGTKNEDLLKEIKLIDRNVALYISRLLMDVLLYYPIKKPTNPEQKYSYQNGLSAQVVGKFTDDEKAIWATDKTSLLSLKRGILKFVIGSSEFTRYGLEDFKLIFLILGSCDSNFHEISTFSDDAIKRLKKVDYENQTLCMELTKLFLGGSGSDGMNRDQCSHKVRLQVIKHMNKSVFVSKLFPVCTKIIFESLFGNTTNDSIRLEGIKFMKLSIINLDLDNLIKTSPIIMYGIKKVLGIGGAEGQINLDESWKSNEVIRTSIYGVWSTLATRFPSSSTIETFNMLFFLLEHENAKLRTSIYEAIHSVGLGLLQNTDKRVVDMTVDIMENKFRVSEHNSVKLCVLRLATEGLDFSNIRAKQLCVYGSGSEDSSVRYAALAGLSLDVSKVLYKLPAVYQDSLLSSNLEEDRKWVKAYKETLPNVVEWVEMVFTVTNSWNNHILNGESDESKGHIGNFALNSLSRKHMFGFTMQLLTVCGLCTIIESDSEKIYSVPQWVISDDSYGVEEAIKILKSWESGNFALNKLFSELNLRKALWVYLNNVFNVPENNKKIIESILICMTPRASPKDKEKHPRTVNSGDDVKASTILRIFSTLGSKTLVGILLQNWEVLYEIGTASVDHRIYTNIAASLGILSMRKCLTCKNPGEFCMNTVEFNHYLDLTNQHLLQLKDEYNKTQFSTLSTHIEHPDNPKVGTLMDTHTILFKLITMGFLISRLKLVSNIEGSVDKTCQPMVDSAISLYQELSGHILKGIYLEMKSTKNASKRYTSVVFRDVCLGLCEFGKFGCLNLEFKEPNVLFYLVEILKTGKLEYKDLRMALKALSSIAMGLGIGKECSEFSELHLEIVKVFSELAGSRKTNFMKLDVQLIVSDFIPLVFAMWNSNLSKVQYEGCLEFPFSKLAGILSPGVWDYLVSEQLPKMAKSQLSTERFAAACWIFNLSYYCQTSSFMVSNGITLHKLVCDLLVDVDETTQSVAGKCLSNLYILNASKAARDEMLYNVIGSLGVRRPAAPIGGGSGSTGPLSELRTAINPSSSTTSGTDLRRNLNSNVVATYRTILNLAMDIKSPDLFYKLVILAGSGIDTQISIGPSSYAALLVKWARDSALEAATPLVPKLYIECFNTNTMIAKAMNIIWQSCFKTTAPNVALNHDSTLISPFSSVVLKHWDTIFKECTLALNSHDYKSRLAGCNSLSSILSLTDNIKRFEKHLNQLWALLFRLLDDMNDSVRAEALKLANSLSNTILAWCESGSLNAGEMVENDQNPLNLVETVVNVVLGSGLSNPAAEVREFCISFLDKLTRLELSKPFSCVISIKLLESLSENENSIVNYFIQNANNWNISVDQIEYARVSATTSSPSMRIIQRCLDNLDHSNLGVFCHDLAKITKHSLSLPSRVGVAKVIMDLCVNRRDEMYDHALILTRAVLAQLTKSTGVEVSIWSNAIAYTCPFLTLEKLEKLMSRIATIYLDNPKSADKRLVSLNVLYQISKRDVDLSSNNLVFSLLYVAKFDENTQISKLASDCIANTAAYFHASAIKKHTSDIISSFIGPMLHSGDFSQINHASVVISDLAKQSIFNPKQLQQSNASTHINTIERQKSLVETRTRSFTSIDPSEFAFLSQLVPLIHELLNLLSSRRFFDGKISAVEALCKLAIVLEPILSTNEYKESPEKLSGLNLEEIYHFMLSLINSNNTSSNVVFKKFALANACALLKYSDSLNAKFSNEFLSLLLSLLTGSSFSTTTSLAGDSRNTSTDIGTSSSPKPAVLALQAVCINGISEILPINTALSTAQYLEILEALFPFCKETPWIVKHAAAQSFLDVFYHYLFNFTRIESTEPRVFLLVHDFLALSSSDIKHSSIKLVALDLCSIILEKRPVLNNNASSSASAIQSLYAKCKDVLITLSTSDPDVRVKNEAKHIFSTI